MDLESIKLGKGIKRIGICAFKNTSISELGITNTQIKDIKELEHCGVPLERIEV